MTRVACLVVNYFSERSVGALLDSFARVEVPESLEVVVVDNSCDDSEWMRLEAAAASRDFAVRTIRSEHNLGYAGGNNLAWKNVGEPRPDVVFVINPDVAFDSGSLREAAEAVHERVNCVSGASTMQDGALLSGLGEMNPWTGAAGEISMAARAAAVNGALAHPMGHFLGMRADDWDALGGFSEDFFLFCEELDLTLRLREGGGRIDILDQLLITHEKGLTTGAAAHSDEKSAVSFRHATRSRVVLYRKHARLRKYLLPMVVARLVWSLGLLARFDRTSAGAVIRGLRDGLAWKPTTR